MTRAPFEYTKTLTISSGSASHTTSVPFSNYLKHIIVVPTTSTNTYNISLSTSDGITIYSRSSQVGNLGIIPTGSGIPLIGFITITIASATIDENINIKLVYE